MTVEPAATRLRHQVPLVAWLVLVWMLLWGTWSWANLLSGLVVALVLLVLLPLPHVVGGTRVRPLALLVFLGHFVADLVVSGAEVAWQALRPGGVRSTAIVQVQLRADSDLLLTMVAEATSLVPGSLVLDLDRERRVMTLHLLPVRDRDDVERKKTHVLVVETRLVRALGSAEDLAALEREEGQVLTS
ncbi:multisubunit sodium/proton antiporter, MrpE subunit [Geodermatophilus saharensis]|uniref:Multisubunit sodium/proton antiporter, MrpE subunit n=1 Tax=Geodermatophilus saharensis TaxID=1137994 RepID=A0A239IL47_9ACTN|nr:Na+/H+ antiporter subunit E [Geodermatophilus saharensis]SNS94317.1 multisubunit sodium/proton antiporter, MrpE subunit [Geodermatophilus saharensis]